MIRISQMMWRLLLVILGMTISVGGEVSEGHISDRDRRLRWRLVVVDVRKLEINDDQRAAGQNKWLVPVVVALALLFFISLPFLWTVMQRRLDREDEMLESSAI